MIPAYAEEAYIGPTLQSLYDCLSKLDWLDSTEVIVVTADAADNTQNLTEEAIKKFPLSQHIQPGPRVGKGRDVKAGLSVARAGHVLFMDADMATPVQYVATAFEMLEKNGGLVIGVRNLGSMHKTLSRKVSSRLSNGLIRSLIGWRITDSQCGFKAFDRQALDIILPRSVIQGWGFDFEFIEIARKHNLVISLLPVPDWHDPKPEGTGLAGDTQFDAMKKTLLELLRVKKNSMKGAYK